MKSNAIYIVVGLVIMFFIMRACEGEPKVVTKTETKIEWKTDTVTVKEIVKQEKPVYVERIKTVKGKDSIIYKDKPGETTITANEFKTKLESNNATADLNIISTGEVLDVRGTITYPEKETITTITKTKDASGKYLYIKTDLFNPLQSIDAGVFFQVKNKVGFIIEAGYDRRLETIKNNGFKVSGGIAIRF